MFTIEIKGGSTHEEQIGVAHAGTYEYTIRAGRKAVIAAGAVIITRRVHVSLLLRQIAERMRLDEFDRIMKDEPATTSTGETEG